MKIITISREFGSGGRELGNRLADFLAFDYYDKEIITYIATKKGMDERYVERALENHGWQNIPLIYGQSFTGISLHSIQTDLLLEQKNVIEQIAKTGKNCVIVGRNADVLLWEYQPFKIFVCADLEAKIRRCIKRAPEDENLSAKEMERKIHEVDKNRAQTRQLVTGIRWGRRNAYHLTVNTTTWNIKELTPAVAEFAKCWFGRTDK